MKNKNQVNKIQAHINLKIINQRKYMDTKNPCLKLDKTFER